MGVVDGHCGLIKWVDHKEPWSLTNTFNNHKVWRSIIVLPSRQLGACLPPLSLRGSGWEFVFGTGIGRIS